MIASACALERVGMNPQDTSTTGGGGGGGGDDGELVDPLTYLRRDKQVWTNCRKHLPPVNGVHFVPTSN